MEPSPLTQDVRPDSFQPKIVRLYETLFKVRAGHAIYRCTVCIGRDGLIANI
jgi:hypothetical protein